jgi:hypothetical protein
MSNFATRTTRDLEVIFNARKKVEKDAINIFIISQLPDVDLDPIGVGSGSKTNQRNSLGCHI